MRKFWKGPDSLQTAPSRMLGGLASLPASRIMAMMAALVAIVCSALLVSGLSPNANAATVTVVEGHATDMNAFQHIGRVNNRDAWCAQFTRSNLAGGDREVIDLPSNFTDTYKKVNTVDTVSNTYNQTLVTKLALAQKYCMDASGDENHRYTCAQVAIWILLNEINDIGTWTSGRSLALEAVNYANANANTTDYVGKGQFYRAPGEAQSSLSVWLEEVPKKGHLRIKKSGGDTSGTVNDGHAVEASIEGAVYGVWTNQSCSGDPIGKLTIGANGESNTISNLNAGTYYVKEISGPTSGKYLIDTEVHDVTVVANQTAETTVPETLLTAFVRVQKKNKSTGQPITTGGFKFALFQSNSAGNGKGPQLEEITLAAGQSEAQFSKKLQAGTYYVQETYAPDPFTKDDKPISITASVNSAGTSASFSHSGDDGYSASGNTATVARANAQVGYIKVIKTNAETGEIVTEAGFEFDLYEENGTTKLASGTTDETGTVIFDKAVPAPGNYIVKEVEVPAPWLVTTKEFPVKLEASGNNGDLKNGHAENGLTNAKNVIDNPVADAPQYGRVTLTKVDVEDNQLQDGAKFKVILLDEKVEYTKQGGENRTPSCGFPAAKTTALTKGSSTFNEATGEVTVTNPIVFATDGNGGTTDVFVTSNGKLTTGWLPIDKSGESHYALVEVGASNGHLINGTQIPFTLAYDKDNESVTVKADQKEWSNEVVEYKTSADGRPLAGVTLGFWNRSDDLTVVSKDSNRDGYALRVSDQSLVPVINQVIEGAEIDGSGIAEGNIVRLVMNGHDDIVIDVERNEVKHAPIGTYKVSLLDSDGRPIEYTGNSTIETKDGSAVKMKTDKSQLTGKTSLEATIGEIENRQATVTYDQASKTYIANDLKPHSTYHVEIDRKTVKVIKTSDTGGTNWFGRYSTTDETYFADHYLDQAALPKNDSNIITKATISGKEYTYDTVTDAAGHISLKRVPFGEYTLAEVKPAVDPLTHKSWLVDTTPHHFSVNSKGEAFPTGYIRDDDKDGDTFEKMKNFSFIDDKTKLKISKKDMTTGEEIEGARLVLTSTNDDVIEEWISTKEEHFIENLVPGTYRLTEFLEPTDYDKASSIEFTLLPSGEVQHTVMFDQPISIVTEIDKYQEIARPLDERYESVAEENNASQQTNENGSYSYSLDFRSKSNTWTDEFTVTDPMEPANDGYAYLETLVTPQAFQDYDGRMNVWYKTNKTPADYIEPAAKAKDMDKETTGKEENSTQGSDQVSGEEAETDKNSDAGTDKTDTDDKTSDSPNRDLATGLANATISDGHVNPWLDDKDAMSADADGDKRIIDYKGWKLWEGDISTSVAEKLNVADLKLDADEHITGIRFEYGRVEVGFTTRQNEWGRDLLKNSHDDRDSIPATSGQSFGDPSKSAESAASQASTFAEYFTVDASKELEETVKNAREKAKQDYEAKLISIDEYNAKIAEYAEGTLPKFAEALTIPAYVDDAEDVANLDASIEAARVSIEAAFSLGKAPTGAPLARAQLLDASREALKSASGFISEDVNTQTASAIEAYSVAMDKAPAPEGGEEMDIATANLVQCLNRILDEIRLAGLSGRVMYAPAILRMRLTDAYVDGITMRNSADVDAYRNGGNTEKTKSKLEDHDHDEVIQRARKKDIRIGTRLATREGRTTTASDGKAVIELIDTVDYHNLVPGHEYEIDGELHIRQRRSSGYTDGGAIAGSAGKTRFTPTSPDGIVEVKLTLPVATIGMRRSFSTTAYEELRVVLPKTGKASDYILAEHKDINDDRQSVAIDMNLEDDLVKTGGTIVAIVSNALVLVTGGYVIARNRRKSA